MIYVCVEGRIGICYRGHVRVTVGVSLGEDKGSDHMRTLVDSLYKTVKGITAAYKDVKGRIYVNT